MIIEFEPAFHALTGNPCFPWQRVLFQRFVDAAPDIRFPEACDLPTGLGKTSVIAVWLLALAHHAVQGTVLSFPRRLVYVVNRRTVVDQSTREAERLRERLLSSELAGVANALGSLCSHDVEGSPLAISTLRGEFADNGEWRSDPARAAVVVGTVDMIGSRLLFSGYGRGFKSRPLHAALLGRDALLVHDEAHLEPAFQSVVEEILKEQQGCSRERDRFHVMALSATARSGVRSFSLTSADLEHEVARRRLCAEKRLQIHSLPDGARLPDRLAELASSPIFEGQAVLVFVRRVKDVEAVRAVVDARSSRSAVLTGTLRGHERDRLARSNPVFARFVPESDRSPECSPQAGTVFLVSTSAGEVGVNLSADHLVCDLTPFDSMVQRLGRVNRFGSGSATVDVVCEQINAEGDALAAAMQRTRSLLARLPRLPGTDRLDASPMALAELPREERLAAFSPQPRIPRMTDVLLDAWSLTTVRDLPGRPPVADFLHGESEWEPPETQVAWRREVEYVTGDLLARHPPDELLEDYPLKAHELLRDRTERVVEQLIKIAERHPGDSAWVAAEDGRATMHELSELVLGDKKRSAERLEGCTVVLPPRVGGLRDGMLVGTSSFDESEDYDVGDEWQDEAGQRRIRQTDATPPRGMRLIRSIVRTVDPDRAEDEVPVVEAWHWFVRPCFADDDGSRTAREAERLDIHLEKAARYAAALSERLLDPEEAKAVRLAAGWHDLGKNRRIWQRSIGNLGAQILAKSGPSMSPRDVTRYRHEFGSLIDLRATAEFSTLSPEQQELTLHLVAAHHGRARPHFPLEESFDPEHPDRVATEVALSVPQRFADLQARYGRWGLAYLESLVRAADALASQDIGSGHPGTEGSR